LQKLYLLAPKEIRDMNEYLTKWPALIPPRQALGFGSESVTSQLHKNTVSKLRIIDEHSVYAEPAHSFYFIGCFQRPAEYFNTPAMSVVHDLFFGEFN
jgi:hypothetical protein